MVVGDKKFGVMSCVTVGDLGRSPSRKLLYFSTSRTAFHAFSETGVWIYSVTLYCTGDRLIFSLYVLACYVYVNTTTRSLI